MSLPGADDGGGDEVAVVGRVHRELSPVRGHGGFLSFASVGVVDADDAFRCAGLAIGDDFGQDSRRDVQSFRWVQPLHGDARLDVVQRAAHRIQGRFDLFGLWSAWVHLRPCAVRAPLRYG